VNGAGRLPDFHGAAVDGMQAAARWLFTVMKQLVDVQCQAYGEIVPKDPEQEYGPVYHHSRPGQPPFKESGVGQGSIDSEDTSVGARVGVHGIGTGNMIGENYMAGWDSEAGIRGVRRPWLHRWKDYRPMMDKIVLREIKIQTGAV